MEETDNVSIEKKLAYLNETKGLIKSAIINKGQELTNETPFRDYVQKINNIETGVDTSDATAIADDILEGKTAYANGEKLVGTMPENPNNAFIDFGTATSAGSIRSYIKSISQLDTSNVTNMEALFYQCFELTTIPFFDTSNVNNMRQMFYNCYKLTTIPLLNTSNVTSMSSMFYSCYELTTIPLLDTSKVADMSYTFLNCSNLKEIPLFDTSKVTNMCEILRGCNKLTIIPLFNTSNVTNMRGMFNGCSSLTEIPLLDTSKVTTMENMFTSCSKLTSIPLLNTSNVTYIKWAFSSCSSLSDESLNNILAMCANAVKITSNKTLSYIGLTSAQATRCQSLSNYQAFLDAGWTTGY